MMYSSIPIQFSGRYEQCLNKESSMLCIHNNSLMLNHIFAFTLPEIQDVPKKGTFPDFDVPFPVTGTGMKIP